MTKRRARRQGRGLSQRMKLQTALVGVFLVLVYAGYEHLQGDSLGLLVPATGGTFFERH